MKLFAILFLLIVFFALAASRGPRVEHVDEYHCSGGSVEVLNRGRVVGCQHGGWR